MVIGVVAVLAGCGGDKNERLPAACTAGPQTVIKALDSVSIDAIRAYAARSFRIMGYYKAGMTSIDAELQLKNDKKHKSHRGVSEREEKKALKEALMEENKKPPRWLFERIDRLNAMVTTRHEPHG